MTSRSALWVVAMAFVAVGVYGYYTQKVVLTRFGDGDEYFFAAEQRAAGQTIRTEVPYVYRVALPWLVAKTFPENIERGFRVYNTIAAAASAILLLLWLQAFGIGPGIAALTTVLYVVNWISPTRFLYFYPIYVDPPFIAMSMGALLVVHRLRQAFSWPALAALTTLCFVGTLFRETMLFVPIAFLFANVRFGDERARARIPAAALVMPLAAGVAAYVICRLMPADPRRVIDFSENTLKLFRTKALFTLVLAFFMTFGPVLAVVLHDWRGVRDVFAKHFYLFVFLGWCFAASYLGGHETERYLLWSAPLIYLLIAQALERHGPAIMRSAWVFVLLVGAQALASHIFFPFPDPSLSVGDWANLTTTGEKLWGAVNRLVIVDDFYWNIWSYFGSRPFHAALLGIYLVFSALLVMYLRWAERPAPAGASR